MPRATASTSGGSESPGLRLVNGASRSSPPRRARAEPGGDRALRVLARGTDAAEADLPPVDDLIRRLDDRELARLFAEGGVHAQQIADALEKLSRSDRSYIERLTVRVGVRLKIVPITEVDYFEADSNYVRLHLGDRSHLVRGPLSALEDQLDPARYLRVHRSLIVALDRVKEIEPYSAGEFVLFLRTGQRLISGRTYKKQVQRAFGIRG